VKIYSMTATFGKLENQTLTLSPGLNVIHAPNEWGKSTWCAFLIAMLYGINTREHTTATSLADKERYAPWSGSPMSGRMDINWNGRDITIERTSGRTPMGEFKAYETASGLTVPELTASNCGQVLLGVEKSVFTRSPFVRLTDLPVTADESLRRRLNALVTTGDESGASDALAQKLRNLQNNCRHNRTGLLPKAEAQRSQIESTLSQLEQLDNRCKEIRGRQESLTEELRLLKNHQAALDYKDAKDSMERIAQAEAAREETAKALAAAEEKCAGLPSQQDAEETIRQLESLQQQWTAQQSEPLPVMPEPVTAPPPFVGLTGDQAVQQAQSDQSALQMLSKPLSPVLLILAIVFALAGLGLMAVKWYLLLPFAVLAVVFFLADQRNRAAQNRDRHAVSLRYGAIPPETWVELAMQYRDALSQWTADSQAYKQQSADLQTRRDQLTQQTQLITQGQPIMVCISNWKNIVSQHTALEKAQWEWAQADRHAQALAQMVKPVTPPAFEDTLVYSRQATEMQLAEKLAEQKALERQLGQAMGQMQALGSAEELHRELEAVNSRIARLEDVYQALVLAQNVLTQAANELQRRFAPKLTREAQSLFEKLTGGRYKEVTMEQDLSVRASAVGETTPVSMLWRSDGTADQLYLALRLAVSRELIPDAPLVLDDALVRFDDDRLALAMGILQEEAALRQVLLFTCQTREVHSMPLG